MRLRQTMSLVLLFSRLWTGISIRYWGSIQAFVTRCFWFSWCCAGQVQLSLNGGCFATVMHVDRTQQFYAFFCLSGKVMKLKFMGVMKESKRIETSGMAQSTASQQSDVLEDTSSECRICFENPIESVLCNCGHSLTCHPCGLRLLGGVNPVCPVCRLRIINVIRIYKA